MSEVIMDTRDLAMDSQAHAISLKACLSKAITDTDSVDTSATGKRKKRVRFAKEDQVILVESYKERYVKEQPCQCLIF